MTTFLNKRVPLFIFRRSMEVNNFAALYRTWSTDKLLDVLDNPDQYQPAAVEAARTELDGRNLTVDQLETARAQREKRNREWAMQEDRVAHWRGKTEEVVGSLVDTINPIHEDTNSATRLIRLISLFIGGVFFYQIYREFPVLQFMFTDSTSRWDLSTVLYLVFVILPVSAVPFWLRKPIGWMLVTIYCSYTALEALILLFIAFRFDSGGGAITDLLFPTISPGIQTASFLMFAGFTWVLCRENLREVYSIGIKAMIAVLLVGVGASVLMSTLFLFS